MATQRNEILECACELYVKRGLEGMSMRRLAREVGVTAPALYRHFDSKEALLLAVVGEAYKLLAQYLHRALGGGTPVERFQMAGEAYLDFALDHPRYYEIMHAPLEAMGIDEYPESLRAQACAVGQFWHDRLREVMDAGMIRRTDPEGIGATMWAHAHGLISLYLRGMMGPQARMDEEAFRNLYRASSRRVMDGIAAEGWRAMCGIPSDDGTRASANETGSGTESGSTEEVGA